jgi:hypothetical protein
VTVVSLKMGESIYSRTQPMWLKKEHCDFKDNERTDGE